MYKEDIELNKLQWLICYKIQQNQINWFVQKWKSSSSLFYTFARIKLTNMSYLIRMNINNFCISCQFDEGFCRILDTVIGNGHGDMSSIPGHIGNTLRNGMDRTILLPVMDR